MPLYTCPQCGANVPDQAPSCARCGQPTQGLQPTGGVGAQPAQAMAPAKRGGAGIVIAVVVALLIVPVVGIFAVLGIYGVRKYIANAKTAEARNAVAHIAKAAASAYEQDGHRLCRSASSAVPADRSLVSGRKYQSTSAEWNVDEDRKAGFACLRFEMPSPQYYQYEYVATATTFVVRAHGDINADGVFSTYELRGEVKDDRVVIAPSILETNPED